MDRARTAWRSAMVAVVLTIVGMPMDFVIGRAVGGIPLWPGLTTIAIAATFLGVLIARHRRPSAHVANTIFLVNAATIIASLWVSNAVYAQSGRTWIPFEANKLGMVTVALLAPELWVGLTGIAAYAGAAYVQMSTFGEAAGAHFALAEPWSTTAFGVFSAVLLASRLRRIALEREVARTKAELAALQRTARFVLAVRDLSNSPLQTIALAMAHAKDRHPDLEPIMRSVERSLARLAELDRVLHDEARTPTWTRREESFDGPDTLRTTAAVR